MSPYSDSPVDILAEDVLAEIFRLVVGACDPMEDATPQSDFQARDDRHLTPLKLTHVSSRWRNVAICNPYLWTSLYVDCPTVRTVPLTRLWLKRGTTMPIKVMLSQYSVMADLEAFKEVVEMLAANSYRWTSLTLLLSCDVKDIVDGLDKVIVGLGRLEYVKMRFHFWDATPELVNAFCSGPVVRTIDLEHTVSSFSLPPLRSWSTIRHFSLVKFNLDQSFVQSLPQCLQLESIVLDSCCSTWFMVVQPITLPSLHTLELANCWQSRTVSNLLNRLVLPSLKTLKVLHCERSRHLIPVLEDMVIRSGCHLTTYSFNEFSSDDTRLLRQLESPALVDLVTLDLGCRVGDPMMSLLTVPNSDGLEVLVNLSSITFGFCAVNSTESIQRMVASRTYDRTANCKKLETLKIGFHQPHILFELTHALTELAEIEGLDFVYSVVIS